MTPLKTLREALALFEQELGRQPERDGLAAEEAALAGVRRPYPALYLNHLYSPDDDTTAPPIYALPPHEFPPTPEGELAREVLGLLNPLDMLNPVCAVLAAGGPRSVADLIPCFGVPLSADKQAAASTSTMDEMLRLPPPDPDTAGSMPEFREHIRLVKELTPSSFRITMPNLQGPFNLAQALLGDDAFAAPLAEPDQFHVFMTRLTDFWIAACERLRAWIGPERLRPADRFVLLAECSANLVSEKFYEQHVLPHDVRIARHFGAIRLHPCSGRHVFRATLEKLPGVRATEAGMMIARMAAPCISVDEALSLIGGRPIALHIGQELPADPEAAFTIMRSDLDRYADNPRLQFGYTGMFWQKKDRPMIRALHRRLDEYWATRYSSVL